jgi:competence protein ComEC
MYSAALGFLTGVLVLQQFSELPPWYWCIPVVLLLPASLRYPKVLPALFAGLGFGWSLLFAHWLLDRGLAPELEGRDLVAQGVVSSLPTVSPHRTRFEFTINELWKIDNVHHTSHIAHSNSSQSGKFTAVPVNNGPEKVLLNWYAPPANLHVGQSWTLMIRLKRPHGFQNPGGFDYEAWLFRQGVRATGYVKNPRKADAIQFTADLPAEIGVLNTMRSEGPGNYWIHGARQWLQTRIGQALDQSPFRGIVTALTIGKRDAITPEQWKVFTKTGTNHLIAISGLHIGLIAGLAFFAMRWLWSRWPYATLRIPAQKTAAILAIFCAVGYAAMAGFAIPTQRACAMVVVVMLSVLLQRQMQPFRILAFAFLVVLVIDPLAVLNGGFWLSFAAVGVLVYGMVGRLAPKGLWWQWGRAQWLVFVGLAPLLLWFFQNLALSAPLANIIAIPWVSFVTVPLSLAGAVLFPAIPTLATWLLQLADFSLQGLWPVLEWFAAMEQPQWLAVKPPLWTLFPAAVGILWYLGPRGLPARWIGILWLAPMFLVSKSYIEEGAAEFTLLDVGQGLAAVVKTQHHVLVYDSGPRFNSGFDTGQAVVLPYLRSEGAQRIDRFVVSHSDNDHIGGARSILAAMPVEQILTSVVSEFTPGQARRCVNGSQWQWDGVRFEFLSPDEEDYDREQAENNLSCVLLVETPSAKVLLTGDIEKSVERELVLEAQNRSLHADILVIPHHGSKTSSSMPFVDRVSPTYALAAVGYRNRYGFPKPQVVERYLHKNVTVLDTAANGAMQFMLYRDRGVVLTQLYRRSARRYWHTDMSEWYRF